MISLTALTALSASRNTLNNIVLIEVKMNNMINLPINFFHYHIQGLGLLHSSRISVEDKTFLEISLFYLFPDNVINNIIGHQFSCLEKLINLES